MATLAVEIVVPFVWAGAAVLVGGTTWIISTATKTGIGDIVERKLQPVRDLLEKHNERFESIDDDHSEEKSRREREVIRLWNAIDDIRRER